MGAVRDIESGPILTRQDGTVELPSAYSGLTVRNQAYVERDNAGRLLILFPTWVGKGLNFAGYLYASKPLSPADFYEIDWGSGGKVKHMDIAGLDYLEVEPLRGPWYRVRREVD